MECLVQSFPRQAFCIIPLHSWCLCVSNVFPLHIIISLRKLIFLLIFSQFIEFLYVFLLLYCLVSGTLVIREGDTITSLFQDKDPATSARCHMYMLCFSSIVISGSVRAFFLLLFLTYLKSLCCSNSLQNSYFVHLVELHLKLYFQLKWEEKYTQESLKCFQSYQNHLLTSLNGPKCGSASNRWTGLLEMN